MAILGQSVTLNICQSVLVVKLPTLMSPKCTRLIVDNMYHMGNTPLVDLT